MPRTSSDKDGDAGTFYAPACPGYHGRFKGRKYPSHTVPLMQHTGHLTYTEQKESFQRTVRQVSGAEEAAVSGGLVEGEQGE